MPKCLSLTTPLTALPPNPASGWTITLSLLCAPPKRTVVLVSRVPKAPRIVSRIRYGALPRSRLPLACQLSLDQGWRFHGCNYDPAQAEVIPRPHHLPLPLSGTPLLCTHVNEERTIAFRHALHRVLRRPGDQSWAFDNDFHCRSFLRNERCCR